MFFVDVIVSTVREFNFIQLLYTKLSDSDETLQLVISLIRSHASKNDCHDGFARGHHQIASFKFMIKHATQIGIKNEKTGYSIYPTNIYFYSFI